MSASNAALLASIARAQELKQDLSRYADDQRILWAIPQVVKDRINDSLTGNEARALYNAITGIAYHMLEVGRAAGKEDADRKDYSDLAERVRADVVAGIITHLQGDDW